MHGGSLWGPDAPGCQRRRHTRGPSPPGSAGRGQLRALSSSALPPASARWYLQAPMIPQPVWVPGLHGTMIEQTSIPTLQNRLQCQSQALLGINCSKEEAQQRMVQHRHKWPQCSFRCCWITGRRAPTPKAKVGKGHYPSLPRSRLRHHLQTSCTVNAAVAAPEIQPMKQSVVKN